MPTSKEQLERLLAKLKVEFAAREKACVIAVAARLQAEEALKREATKLADFRKLFNLKNEECDRLLAQTRAQQNTIRELEAGRIEALDKARTVEDAYIDLFTRFRKLEADLANGGDA